MKLDYIEVNETLTITPRVNVDPGFVFQYDLGDGRIITQTNMDSISIR